MECIDRFEYKGFEFPLNMSNYVRGGNVIVGCKRSGHYSHSNLCDGETHPECTYHWAVLAWVVVMCLCAIIQTAVKLSKKSRTSTMTTPSQVVEDSHKQEEVRAPRQRAGPADGVSLQMALLSVAIIMTSTASGCSQVFPSSSKYESCNENGCETHWLYHLNVGNGDEVCVPTTKGLVSLGVYNLAFESTPDFSLMSSEWGVDVESKRQCHLEGQCGSCEDKETESVLGVPGNLSISGCFSKCGCATCGCFSCKPSCLYWKATVVPQGAKYLVQRFTDYSFGLHVTSHGTKEFLEQGRHVSTQLGLVYIGSLGPPSLGTICLRQDHLLDVPECKPNRRGVFGMTYDGKQPLFDMSRVSCTSTRGMEVSCKVSDSGLHEAMYSLPHYKSGFIINKMHGKLRGEYQRPAVFSILLKRKRPLEMKFVSDNRSCTLLSQEQQGCHSCETGFFIMLNFKGHGHCYYENNGLSIPNTLIDCSASNVIHGSTNAILLPELRVCGQKVSFSTQLSPPKVMQEDGVWKGKPKSTSSWWSPLLSLQGYGLKLLAIVSVSIVGILVVLHTIKQLKQLFS